MNVLENNYDGEKIEFIDYREIKIFIFDLKVIKSFRIEVSINNYSILELVGILLEDRKDYDISISYNILIEVYVEND